MTLYLLDANVLITANNSYYPVDRVPEYWEWLDHMAERGSVKIPVEQYEEVKEGPDDEDEDLLYKWIREPGRKDRLLLDVESDLETLQLVVAEGYAPDLTDDELEQIGRDPFLIAYGRLLPACVVTVEVSKPSKQRQNRHIPDVCKSLGVECCDPFKMYRDLEFRTSWKNQK